MSRERNEKHSGQTERMRRREKIRQERREFRRKQFEKHIARRTLPKDGSRRGNQERKEWFGVFIIAVGLIWLGNELWGPFPGWLFSWQSLVIAFGIAVGLGSSFRNKGAFIFILIGGFFMARDYFFPEADLGAYIWPVIIIAIGVLFIIKKREGNRFRQYIQDHPDRLNNWRDHWHREDAPPPYSSKMSSAYREKEQKQKEEMKKGPEEEYASQEEKGGNISGERPEPDGEEHFFSPDKKDWLYITTFLSGTRRIVNSKHFKGGEIVSIMGGSEADLSRADINGIVTLEITNIMGGIRLAVPPNWQIHFNCTCIMGGADDERSRCSEDPDKTLVLTGMVVMGGIEVRDVF